MFEPRLALASLSGQSDAEWAENAQKFAGAAMLGGIALDEPTREAAREMVERDREEFLPENPVAFVDRQLAALGDADIRPGFNVRTATLPPLRKVAETCADRDALLELNAHCRQDEMCRAGAGEALLRDSERLREQVRTAASEGATVSVKVRAELPGVNLPEIARLVADAGGHAVHVDAMDSEGVVAEIADAAEATDESDLFVIANNGVRDRATVREYLAYGADAVSVGRPSDDPAVLRRVRSAVDEWFEAESIEEAKETEVEA
ncbi:tRNA-dihydrouridine synthase [Halorussus ruber]|uniref:tRNA-dihydrouridine synthase n=1 Tax=Halorussus ruber TaxID=1126238 RepID=UPI001091AF6B|nr:tRNA-dihydrouridine synthase [Halorussus ruber]